MTIQARKRLFVHKAIQGNLVSRFAMHWLIFAGLTCCLQVVLQSLFNASMTAETRSHQIRLTVISFGLVSIALLPAFTYDLLRLSNRFVGPIVRLQKYLRHLHSESIKPLSIRKDDYWQDLVQDFNGAIDRLSDKKEVTHRVPLNNPQPVVVAHSMEFDARGVNHHA